MLLKGSFGVKGAFNCAMPHEEDFHDVGGVYKNNYPLRGKSGSSDSSASQWPPEIIGMLIVIIRNNSKY